MITNDDIICRHCEWSFINFQCALPHRKDGFLEFIKVKCAVDVEGVDCTAGGSCCRAVDLCVEITSCPALTSPVPRSTTASYRPHRTASPQSALAAISPQLSTAACQEGNVQEGTWCWSWFQVPQLCHPISWLDCRNI